MARQPLGRGLSALMGEVPARSEETVATNELDIDLIEPNPEQPRTRFAEENLNELAASIRANGIVQPVVVRKLGNRYQIVAGERRWRAAQLAEMRRVPVVVKDVSDDKMLEIALIENIQRHELNPIEEAKAYRKLIDNIGLTQEEVSARIGKERSLIASSIRLLKLSDRVQRLIIDGKLSFSHGRALLLTDDQQVQNLVAQRVIDESLSVRATEAAVKKGLAGNRDNKKTMPARTTDPNVKIAETKLMRHLGTNVKILSKHGSATGKIEIEYYSNDDLDRIYQAILK
ncbi:MAG TPA: ParB/RepB/Spo0J family partition protein [Pyrinomonadaceae bacterium]|nr:ParB/RepB/Spo0J family partition protein [Pyrinomonadaceae bacterium]